MENKKQFYIECLRALATVAVITYHVGSGNSASDDIVRCLYSNLNVWCVPVFFMITGALLLATNKDLSLKTHGKRVVRLLASLLIWGFVYNAITTVIVEKSVAPRVFIHAAYMTVMADTTYAYQLWYLYYVIGIYLILPVIASFLRNASTSEIYVLIALCMLFGIVVPTIREVFGISVLPWGGFCYFSGYLVYVLLGYYLSQTTLNGKTKGLIYVAASLMVILVTVLTITGVEMSEKLGHYETIFAMVVSGALFILIKDTAHKIENIGILKKIVSVISKHSFAIFLLHVMIIQMLRKLLHIDSTILPLAASIPLLTLIVLVISLLMSVGLKKIKILKNIL